MSIFPIQSIFSSKLIEYVLKIEKYHIILLKMSQFKNSGPWVVVVLDSGSIEFWSNRDSITTFENV